MGRSWYPVPGSSVAPVRSSHWTLLRDGPLWSCRDGPGRQPLQPRAAAYVPCESRPEPGGRSGTAWCSCCSGTVVGLGFAFCSKNEIFFLFSAQTFIQKLPILKICYIKIFNWYYRNLFFFILNFTYILITRQFIFFF